MTTEAMIRKNATDFVLDCKAELFFRRNELKRVIAEGLVSRHGGWTIEQTEAIADAYLAKQFAEEQLLAMVEISREAMC